jgi:hypothetical protein
MGVVLVLLKSKLGWHGQCCLSYGIDNHQI